MVLMVSNVLPHVVSSWMCLPSAQAKTGASAPAGPLNSRTAAAIETAAVAQSPSTVNMLRPDAKSISHAIETAGGGWVVSIYIYRGGHV